MNDPHQILGVPAGSSPEQLKAAYRKRAMETHPDRGGKPGEFQAVQQAYEALTSGKWKPPSQHQPYRRPGPKPQYRPPTKSPHDYVRHIERGEVDLWSQTAGTKRGDAYWDEYKRLKESEPDMDSEEFWLRMNRWQVENTRA